MAKPASVQVSIHASTEGWVCGLIGYKDADGGANGAIRIQGRLGEAADTTTLTSSDGVVVIRGSVIDGGTAVTAVADAGNILTIDNNGTARFLIEGNGDVHGSDSDGTEAFDSHNDAALIAGLEDYRFNSQSVVDFEAMRASSMYDDLVALGLIGSLVGAKDEDENVLTEEEAWAAGIRPLFNRSAERRLHRGNSTQAQGRLDALLDALETTDPAFRGRMNANLNARGLGHLGRP